MYTIDSDIKQAFLASKRKVGLKIVIAGQFTLTEDNIISMKITSTMGSGDAFTIGNYTKRQLDITLVRKDAPLALSNKQVKVYAGIDVSGVRKYFLIGTFQTDSNSLVINRTTVSIKAYDSMRKCKKGALSIKTAYTNKNLTFYADMLAKKLGVSLTDSAQTLLANVDKNQKWTLDLEKGGNTIVRTMQAIALALGSTAVITNDNKLDFIRIRPKSNIKLTPDFYTDLDIQDLDEFTIEGLKLIVPKELTADRKEDITYYYPNSTIKTSIEIQETKSDLFKDKSRDVSKQLGYISDNMLIGRGKALPFTYMGYELECPSLPFIETGDVISAQAYDGTVYELMVITHELNYSNGSFLSKMKAELPSSNNVQAIESSAGAITGALTIATTKILEVNKLVANHIEATKAEFDILEAKKANIEDLNVTNETVKNLQAKSITTDNLAAKVANINSLTAQDAIIKNISSVALSTEVIKAAVADVGYVTTDKLDAAIANSEKLTAIDADITKLKADTADVSTLRANSAAINKLVTGSVDINEGSFIQIKADTTRVENGFIKDAMIGNVSASKINTGTINTNLVNIQGSNGNFLIKDNTLQIKDTDNKVRIQMGLDSQQQYNLGIYDANGNVLFDALGLGSNTVRDINVAANANISAGKLNIDSLYEEINNEDNEHTIKATKIFLDEEQATLDASFREMSGDLDTALTQIQVNADGINLVTSKINDTENSVNKVTQSVNGLRNEYNTTKENVDGLSEFTRAYFEESSEGKFIIGKGVEGNCARMSLDTDRVEFINAANEVTAYFGNDGFGTTQGIVTTGVLTIGNFAFIPRDNGSLDFKKIS